MLPVFLKRVLYNIASDAAVISTILQVIYIYFLSVFQNSELELIAQKVPDPFPWGLALYLILQVFLFLVSKDVRYPEVSNDVHWRQFANS